MTKGVIATKIYTLVFPCMEFKQDTVMNIHEIHDYSTSALFYR